MASSFHEVAVRLRELSNQHAALSSELAIRIQSLREVETQLRQAEAIRRGQAIYRSDEIQKLLAEIAAVDSSLSSLRSHPPLLFGKGRYRESIAAAEARLDELARSRRDFEDASRRYVEGLPRACADLTERLDAERRDVKRLESSLVTLEAARRDCERSVYVDLVRPLLAELHASMLAKDRVRFEELWNNAVGIHEQMGQLEIDDETRDRCAILSAYVMGIACRNWCPADPEPFLEVLAAGAKRWQEKPRTNDVLFELAVATGMEMQMGVFVQFLTQTRFGDDADKRRELLEANFPGMLVAARQRYLDILRAEPPTIIAELANMGLDGLAKMTR